MPNLGKVALAVVALALVVVGWLVLRDGGGPRSVSEFIEAEYGGIVLFEDAMSITIPPDALTGDTDVNISRPHSGLSDPGGFPGADPLGEPFRIEIGEQSLRRPVQIEMKLDSNSTPGTSADTAFLAYYDEGTQTWVPFGGTVFLGPNVVTAEVDHLSWWNVFSWNWDAWIAVVSQGLSLELSEWMEAAHLLTEACDQEGDYASIDDSKANHIIQGCLTSDDIMNSEFRLVNLKSYFVGISRRLSDPNYLSSTVLGPGESVAFTANAADEPPLVIYADLTDAAMWRLVVELVARMLPAGELIADDGLSFIAEGLQRVVSADELSEDLAAGESVAAAESLYALVTGDTFVEAFVTLATQYGRENGVDMMTKWTEYGVRNVLIAVAAVDVIVSVTDFIANYLVSNQSELSFTWNYIAPVSITSPDEFWNFNTEGSGMEDMSKCEPERFPGPQCPEVIGGEWFVVGFDRLSGRGLCQMIFNAGYPGRSYERDPFIFLGRNEYRDVAVSANFYLGASIGYSATAIFVFRARDDDNYYQVTVSESSLSISKLVAGELISLAVHGVELSRGERQTLQIEAVGNIIRAFLPGVAVQVEDTTFSEGRIGLKAGGTQSTGTCFDNVAIAGR